MELYDCDCHVVVSIKHTIGKAEKEKIMSRQVSSSVNGDEPFVSDEWRVEFHHKTGNMEFVRDEDQFFLDEKKIDLFQSKSQKKGAVTFKILRKELEGKEVLNACMFDYFYEHKNHIPHSVWLDYGVEGVPSILFWGTIYRRSSDGRLYVRTLFFDVNGWEGGFTCVDKCEVDDLAAVLVS